MLFFFHWVRNFEDNPDWDNDIRANLIHFYFSQKENELAILRITLPRASSAPTNYGVLSAKDNNGSRTIFRGVVTKYPLEFDDQTISIELVSKSLIIEQQIAILDEQLKVAPYYDRNFDHSQDSSDILATRNLQYYCDPATGIISISHISKGKRVLTIDKCVSNEVEFRYVQDPITNLDLEIVADWIYEKDEVYNSFGGIEAIRGISSEQIINSWKKLQISGVSKHYEIISSSLICANTGKIHYTNGVINKKGSIGNEEDKSLTETLTELFSNRISLDQLHVMTLKPELLIRLKQRQKICEKLSVSIKNPHIDHIPSKHKKIKYLLRLDRDYKIPSWSQYQFYKKDQIVLHLNSTYKASIDHLSSNIFSHSNWEYLRDYNGEHDIRSKKSFFSSHSGRDAIIHGLLRAISTINISMRSIEVTIHGVTSGLMIDLNLDDTIIYRDHEFSICGKLISKELELRFGHSKTKITIACELGQKSELEDKVDKSELSSLDVIIERSQLGYCDEDYCEEDYIFTVDDNFVIRIDDWIVNHDINHIKDPTITKIAVPKINDQFEKQMEIIEATMNQRSIEELPHEKLMRSYSQNLPEKAGSSLKSHSEELVSYMKNILSNYQPEISLELPPISSSKLVYREYISQAVLEKDCFYSGITRSER